MSDTLRRLRAAAAITTEAPSFASARYSMARIRVTEDGGIDAAFERATAISARVLKVPRVGIWLFEADGRSLRCAHLHSPEGTSHPEPRFLDGDLYPKYVDALKAQVGSRRTTSRTTR